MSSGKPDFPAPARAVRASSQKARTLFSCRGARQGIGMGKTFHADWRNGSVAELVEQAMNAPSSSRVSVVIPCYNYAHYLPEAINSALAQDYPNIEVIVVDDGSTDESAAVAGRYKDKVRLLRQSNKGLPAARNAGIRAASGEFVLCLDADDRILAGFCTCTAPVLANNPEVGIVATGLRFFGAVNYTFVPRALSLQEHLAINQISCSSLFRKCDWDLVGGYDETMRDGFEDWEFWIRIRKAGRQLTVVPEVLFEYRRKTSSMVTDSLARSRDILRFMHDKHADLYREHYSDIHILLFGLRFKAVTVGEIQQIQQPVANNGWKDKIPLRLKHLAKAVLPNSLIQRVSRL